MNAGDIVKFKNETDVERLARENGTVTMRVVWIDEPRMMVELEIPGWTINPTAIYNIEDMEGTK